MISLKIGTTYSSSISAAIPKRGKYTKGQQNKTEQVAVNKPNDRKIYQPFPLKGSIKYAQICIFGMQIYHLATLATTDRNNLGSSLVRV
jgi:hypothetical protein